MDILVIGDIHGLTCWQPIVEKYASAVDKVVFLGDYFDTFDKTCTPVMQIENFLQIVDFAKKHKGKVDLLMGNHDAQYFGSASWCSGHHLMTEVLAYKHFKELYKRKKIKMVVDYDNYLFSHAGVSAVWMKNNEWDSVEEINERFYKDKSLLDFVDLKDSIQKVDASGENDFQNPVWIRPTSLMSALYGRYNQVVGHTHLPKIKINVVNGQKLIIADTLPNQYLIVDTRIEEEIVCTI
jgi:predicted phosphodiesterase